MRTLASVIAVLRPHNVAAAVLSVAVGFAMAGGGRWPWSLLAAAALATAAGHTVNDIYDLDIDRVNKPKRPLPAGALSLGAAWVQYFVLVVGTIAVALTLQRLAAVWVAAWIVLLHLYSARLKRMYLAGNVLVSAIGASGFLLGASAGGDIRAGFVPAAYTFFFIMGREIVKDTADIEGDRASGARTLPIVSGARPALLAAAAIFAALCVAFPLPAELGYYEAAYGWIMLSTLVPILLVSVWLVLGNRSLALVSSLLKLGMFLGCVAFYLGARR